MENYQDLVLKMIVLERDRQDKQWGGPNHDDQHSTYEWVGYIFKQLGKLFTNEYEFRQDVWVKIGALAVAAAESDFRNTQKEIDQVNLCKCGLPLTGPGSHEDDTKTEWDFLIESVIEQRH